MLHPAVFLLKLSVYSSLSSFVVKAKLFADCTFEEVKPLQTALNTSVESIKLNGQLSYSKNVFHSCLVQADNRNSLLFLRAKRNKESKGELVFFCFFYVKFLKCSLYDVRPYLAWLAVKCSAILAHIAITCLRSRLLHRCFNIKISLCSYQRKWARLFTNTRCRFSGKTATGTNKWIASADERPGQVSKNNLLTYLAC